MLYKRNQKYLSLLILCLLIYVAAVMPTRHQVEEALQGANGPCPNDLYVYNVHWGACYLFVHSPIGNNVLNWEAAEEYCDEQQASLVHVESEAEQEWINRFIRLTVNDDREEYWLGAKIKQRY